MGASRSGIDSNKSPIDPLAHRAKVQSQRSCKEEERKTRKKESDESKAVVVVE